MPLASRDRIANHPAMPRPPSLPDDPALADFLRSELGLQDDSASAATAWSHNGAVWVWRGSGNGPPPKAAWYFLTIDGDTAAAIRAATGKTNGFGSVRVTATIGKTSWQTSLFPSKDSGGYLLPLKASVRRTEALDGGTATTVILALA